MTDPNPATPRPVAVEIAEKIVDTEDALGVSASTDLLARVIDAAITADPLLSAAGEMRRLLREVWDSTPATYNQDDPMVKRHAKALTAIPDLLKRAGIE